MPLGMPSLGSDGEGDGDGDAETVRACKRDKERREQETFGA